MLHLFTSLGVPNQIEDLYIAIEFIFEFIEVGVLFPTFRL